MATTQVSRIRQTGFKVGSVDCRFGLMWPDGGFLMTDWQRESRVADLDGANLTVTQLLGFRPRRVTYRVFFEAVADYLTFAGLVQQTGTLTLVHDGHTVPTDNDDEHYFPDRVYDTLADATLLSLLSLGVAADGSVECDAVFQVT